MIGRSRTPTRHPARGPVLAASVLVASGLVGCGAVSEYPAEADPAILNDSSGSGSGEPRTPQEIQVQIRPTVVIPTEWGSAIEELYGRYWLYWEAFAAAHGPPKADPTYEPLKDLSTARNWDSLSDQLRGFAADGLVLSLPQVSVTEHLLRIPNASLLTTTEGDEVVLQDCWIDDFIQKTLAGDVVNEANEAKLMNVTMKVENGTWRVDGITHAAPDSDGYEQCADLLSS